MVLDWLVLANVSPSEKSVCIEKGVARWCTGYNPAFTCWYTGYKPAFKLLKYL
jgi:hypothetical protein